MKGVYGVEEKFVKLVIRYIEVKNLMFMVNISVVYFMFNVWSKLMLWIVVRKNFLLLLLF